jgi:hypothetical protein
VSTHPLRPPRQALPRVAGQYVRARQRLYVHRAVVGMLVLIAVMLVALLVLGPTWPAVGVEAATIAALLAIDRTTTPRVERWGRGAQGEELVGRVLDGLRVKGWFALHDINSGRGNIDHVLVGPAGIFTIETKSHRGQIHTAQIDASMLRQAYAEAKYVEKIIGSAELKVEPMLVFSRAYLVPRGVCRRSGVTIAAAGMLAGHLGRRSATIPPDRVAQIYQRLTEALSD